MKRRFAMWVARLLVCFLTLTGGQRVGAKSPELLIHIFDTGGGTPGQPEVIDRYKIWDDGTMISFEGRSARTDRLSYEQMTQLKEVIKQSGLDEFARKHRLAWTGPSASYRVVRVAVEGNEIELASWHERYADNPKLVVTDKGVRPIGNRTKKYWLAVASKEYQEFIRIWTELTTAVKELSKSLPAKAP